MIDSTIVRSLSWVKHGTGCYKQNGMMVLYYDEDDNRSVYSGFSICEATSESNRCGAQFLVQLLYIGEFQAIHVLGLPNFDSAMYLHRAIK